MNMENITKLNKDEIIDIFKSSIEALSSNKYERIPYYMDKICLELMI